MIITCRAAGDMEKVSGSARAGGVRPKLLPAFFYLIPSPRLKFRFYNMFSG
jgi:hypothetical protein